MKDNKLHIFMEDPELPKQLKDARRNHGGMTVPEDFFAQFERKMNAVIDADLSDIMKKSSVVYLITFVRTLSELAGDPFGILGNTEGMAPRILILGIYGVYECGCGLLEQML